MNFQKNKLKELKRWYEILTFHIIKNQKKKDYQNVPKEYNIILDLIEDIEELNKWDLTKELVKEDKEKK